MKSKSVNELVRQRFGTPADTGKHTASSKTISTILSRRSCRNFSSDPVHADLMRLLFSAAFSAPSKSDLQQVSVVHVQDKRKQERIAELSASTAWVSQAPEFMVFCGDSRRIRRLCEWRRHPFANDHLDAFMNAAVDAGIVMQTFIIAAESMGLGCCPVSEVRNNIASLSTELNLPRYVFPVAGLCVGWPTGGPLVSQRLPLDVTVHVDEYSDHDLIEQVTDYDRRREALDQTPAERQRMVERFGVSTEYGWSENRTRQYAVSARADFGRYIRDQGFDLS